MFPVWTTLMLWYCALIKKVSRKSDSTVHKTHQQYPDVARLCCTGRSSRYRRNSFRRKNELWRMWTYGAAATK